MQGLKYNSLENYNSTPGLNLWQNSIDNSVIQTSGRVSAWNDKSSKSNNVSNPLPDRRPYYDNDMWVYSADSNLELFKSPVMDLRFTHNGSKFGIYTITKTDWSLATPGASSGCLNMAAAAGVGLQSQLNSGIASGWWGYTSRGGASSPNRVISNILNPIHANYVPSGTVVSTAFVNVGQTVGIKMKYGHVLVDIAPFFSSLGDYPTAMNQFSTICRGSTEVGLYTGLVLVYNWTGYSDAQVLNFDASVKALLAQDLTIFQTLDA